jgi:peptide/nickel transport system ATP-binding protein
MTIVFVTHDLALVAELAQRVAVMYAGRLVEAATVEEIFYARRRHPYAKALIEAIPSVMGDRALIRSIPGQVPNLLELPTGCPVARRPVLSVMRRSRLFWQIHITIWWHAMWPTTSLRG